MGHSYFDFSAIEDNKLTSGKLIVLEKSNIPFRIKRVYTVYKVLAGDYRGNHAHRNLKQVMFCSYGAVEILLDNGITKERFLLDDPSKVLIIDVMLWRVIEWKISNSVLTVLASEDYDESDYIRDYDEFMRILANEKNSI